MEYLGSLKLAKKFISRDLSFPHKVAYLWKIKYALTEQRFSSNFEF